MYILGRFCFIIVHADAWAGRVFATTFSVIFVLAGWRHSKWPTRSHEISRRFECSNGNETFPQTTWEFGFRRISYNYCDYLIDFLVKMGKKGSYHSFHEPSSKLGKGSKSWLFNFVLICGISSQQSPHSLAKSFNESLMGNARGIFSLEVIKLEEFILMSNRSGVGVLKLRSLISPFGRHVKFFKLHSYLTGVTAAEFTMSYERCCITLFHIL